MIIQRFYLDCLSHASYLVGDEETGQAAVIDPQRDVDQYVQEAEERGLKIRYVILTHFHADFVAGHIELRDRLGAEIVLGKRAEADFTHRKLGDGDSLELGDVRLEGLETPGHTPEGLTVLVFDKKASNAQPYAAFTGDTLFIGDVGRPDLLASIGVTADELASMLYDSLHSKILPLPDDMLIYPAHGAGSMCGKALSDEAVSTLGEQRKYNYALQPMEREEFMKLVEVDQPDAPGYFVHDAILNRKERASLDENMRAELSPLSLQEMQHWIAKGAQLLDTRSSADFAAAHVRGAINVCINGKYATWAGTVLSADRPIVIIADEERVSESVMRLGRIGFDDVVGYLANGMEALHGRDELLQKTQRITPVAAAEMDEAVILDVRAKAEWEAGHIRNSLNIPLNRLVDSADDIPSGKPVIVHCQGGYRSAIASSLLQAIGSSDVFDMVGGYKAWEKSHLPVVSPVKA